MNISHYAASAESFEALSQYQINNFFRRHTSVTQNSCDETAAKIITCSVSPTPVQGVGSYTVAGGSKVVQFRDSELDLQVVSKARLTYGEFVMGCWATCLFTRWTWFLVLPSARLGGCSLPGTWSHACCGQFRTLLFRPGYPMILNHDDLLEMNIHIDAETGNVTGIVDWADAKISPFGLSLWGLETLLGVQTSSSWHFHPGHDRLRAQFWETFYGAVGDLPEDDRRAIEVARLLGLFRAYGFDLDPDKDDAVPVGEEDHDFVCLEALCLR